MGWIKQEWSAIDVIDAVSFGMKAACLKRARTATPDPRGIDPTVEIDSPASLVDLPDS
jgi:hypothetical protein